MSKITFRYKAFFNKKFMGLGVDFDTYLPYNGKERYFSFQITLLWFRFWINTYKD